MAKSLGYLAPQGLDFRAPLTADVQALLQRTLAEILGLAQGFCAGRGGSMHLQWAEAGALGTNAIVGGGVPLAAGAAWAHKHAGTDAVAMTCFGDGAVNIGSALESMNLAAAWQLPLCFFIENNGYAVSTRVEEATREPRLSSRGSAFGIPSWKVDGMDPLAVWLATREALAHMRAGHGPTLIEVDVYRYFHQNGPFPGSAFGYRDKAEEAAWRARDPLELVAAKMRERDLVSEAEVATLRETVKSAMRQAAAELLEADPDGKPGKRRIRPALWPSPDFRDVALRSDLDELTGARTEELATYGGRIEQRKFIDVVADVMGRRMETDERVVVLGEDVHKLKGGTNGATRGLSERFPGRVLGTPISENAFAGLGGGMAMDGRFRPVVEFMYPDFLWVAADQVFNQIGKARHMFGGGFEMPLVLRTKVAMGTGYGSQHSMDPAGIFATSPGWRIVGAVDAVRLRRPDERRAGLQGPGAGDRARRPVRQHRAGGGRRPGLPAAVRQGRRAARRCGSDRAGLFVDGGARAGRGGADRHRRRGDRPALARSRQPGLGHHRGQHPQDQPRADRRAGRARHLLWRLAGRRAAAPLFRLAGSTDPAGHRRRSLAQHLQGAGARGDRAQRGSRGGTAGGDARQGRPLTWRPCCACPRWPPARPTPPC
ncbi:1-deoxy-D-xylulose-5-phosphate synthase [Rhodanobacter lindaniclasticus]